jgi:toxin-antitoxin system PIN domain toxin
MRHERLVLLDVNVLIAIVWDSHVHHHRARTWFSQNAGNGWATCPVTESGFVRVSCNPVVLPAPITIEQALDVLGSLRAAPRHDFFTDDVSPVDADFPTIVGHKQVTDAHLLTLARRHQAQLVTFDSALSTLPDASADVVVLRAA